MRIEDTFYLGKVTKLYSFKGEVILFLDVDDPSKYDHLDSVMLDINGSLVPHFIEKKTHSSADKIRVKFEGIDNEAAAKKLVNKEIRMPLSMLPPSGDNDFYLHEVIGFRVVDKTEGEIGKIDSIIEATANSLFRIYKGYDEILIPINDDLISRIDKKDQVIEVDCPEGLLDLYLDRNDENDEVD
jgi:16S rRNA processing protein RimM